MKLIYICGPIRNDDADIQTANIIRGIEAAKAIWQAGAAAFCPHMNAFHFPEDNPAAEQTRYIEGDIEMIKRCDAVLALPGWQESRGAMAEIWYCTENGIKILDSVEKAVRWVKS